jgi:hypothetical protein
MIIDSYHCYYKMKILFNYGGILCQNRPKQSQVSIGAKDSYCVTT